MKTSELTGAALDWAVGTASGKSPKIDRVSFRGAFITRAYLRWSYAYSSNGSIVEYCPSSDWSCGGPIIEREGINLFQRKGLAAKAGNPWLAYNEKQLEAAGPTPLIAAMRCYVTSKLGDDVELPKELAP